MKKMLNVCKSIRSDEFTVSVNVVIVVYYVINSDRFCLS